MSAKIQVVFYSMYGHVYEMAEAVAEGARQGRGAEVSLWQVPELVPDAMLQKSGADIARAAFVHVPVAQHGGQETTLVSFHTTLLHHGMIVVGLPYTEPRLTNMTEITGGTPYGASTVTGVDGARRPSENELAIARFQGRHVAEITTALIAARNAK